MNKKKSLYLLIFMFILAANVRVSAQTPPALTLSALLEQGIKGGESPLFSVRTDANKYVRIVIFQEGVDVFTTVFDAEKKKIAEVDSPNGRNGPEKLEFVAEAGGEYLIEVKTGRSAPAGKFKITLEEIRSATDDDRTKMRANNIFWAADALRQKGTADARRESIVQYANALALYEKLQDTYGRAYANHSLGLATESLGDYKKALEFYTAAFALWQEVRDRPGEAAMANRIGTMHYYLGNSESSIAWSNKAFPIMIELGNRTGEATVYNNLAVVYARQGDYPKAIELYEKSLKIQLEVGRKDGVAAIFGNIAVANLSLGNFDAAMKNHLQALALWRELGRKDDEGQTLIQLGVIDLNRGEARKAIELFGQALPLCLESGNKNCEAAAYSNLATGNRMLGEIQSALDFAAKSVEIYRVGGKRDGLAGTLNEAGTLYAEMSDDKRALEAFVESLGLFLKSNNRLDEAVVSYNLGDLFKRQGDAAKSREFYVRSLNIRRDIKDLNGVGVSLSGLGYLELAQGNVEAAIKLFEEALDIDVKTGVRVNEARVLVNLGAAYDEQGKFPQSLDYFNRALAGFRALDVKPDEAYTLYRLSQVQKKTGRFDEAIKNIEAAIAIIETLRGNITAAELRSSYFASAQRYYDLYIELLMLKHKAQPDERLEFKAFQTSEVARARGLLDLLQEAKIDLRGKVSPELLLQEKELIEQINAKAAKQMQAANDPQKKELARNLSREIETLSGEYETVQTRIKQTNPRYADITKKPQLTIADTQKLLDDKTILAEFKLGANHSYLWLVSRAKIESYELPPESEIEDAAHGLYLNLTERNQRVESETADQKELRLKKSDAMIQENAAKLRDILFGKVGSKISGKTVAVIADGGLQRVPFNVLLEGNEVITLPSLSVLSEIRARLNAVHKPEKTIAVFADPIFEATDSRLDAKSANVGQNSGTPELKKALRDFEFGEKFPRLLSTRIEARDITSFVPKSQSDLELDFDASRENVLGTDLTHYRIIHFATHGLLNTNRPELSGLVFSLYDKDGAAKDGFLRLNQIYNLNLNSDLVVLSACQTALGRDVRGEGVIGLTRGFIYAGANRVVSSLWKVDDAATAEFMKRLYQNLLQKKLKPSAALLTAQNEMKKIPRFKSPYYWAGFTIQGDWH